MANKTGAKKGISNDELVDAWLRNNQQIKATARELGCYPANVQRRLRKLWHANDPRVDPAKLLHNHQDSDMADKVLKAQIELGMRNERKKNKGDWRKPTLIHRPHNGVAMLGLFGDPHVDNDGTNRDLLEDELSRANPAEGIYTACVGDFFDNWPRALGHLYRSSEPEAAWTVFKYWMENWPFLFAVSGNHDEFTESTANFLNEFMRERGVVLRRSGGRFILDLGAGEPITISMRHIWQGNSMYSEAHPLKRAATMGFTSDDIVTGGHTHKGELRQHVRPEDGKVSKLVQVSSFKEQDDYANDKGFMSAETPPVMWCVLDARQPVTSHERVQPFYDFDTARAVYEHRRRKNA